MSHKGIVNLTSIELLGSLRKLKNRESDIVNLTSVELLGGQPRESDINNLDFEERKNPVERLVKVAQEDNEKFLRKLKNRIDRQENTVVQTCDVACYSMVSAGGFGSYLLGLNKRTYAQSGVDTPDNTSGSYKDPAFGWMAGFLFVSAFVELLALVPLRKYVT
ncbi:hypothetical protein QQ045_026677 [Rhodiola kirilowii]